MLPAPYWIQSPYIKLEFGNWTLSEDAPEDLKKNFYSWMKQYGEAEESGESI